MKYRQKFPDRQPLTGSRRQDDLPRAGLGSRFSKAVSGTGDLSISCAVLLWLFMKFLTQLVKFH